MMKPWMGPAWAQWINSRKPYWDWCTEFLFWTSIHNVSKIKRQAEMQTQWYFEFNLFENVINQTRMDASDDRVRRQGAYVWLEKVCKAIGSFRRSNKLIVLSEDAVAKIHSLNGLKDTPLTWDQNSSISESNNPFPVTLIIRRITSKV